MTNVDQIRRESKKSNRLYLEEKAVIEITELICRQMEQNGVSKRMLAKRLGVKKKRIVKWLDGSRNMTIRQMADLLWACGCELHDAQVVPDTYSPFNVAVPVASPGQPIPPTPPPPPPKK